MSSDRKRPQRSSEAGAKNPRRLSRARDQALTALSWVPFEQFRFPPVLILICLPVLYLLLAPSGMFSSRVRREPEAPTDTVEHAEAPADAAPDAASDVASPKTVREDPFRKSFDAMAEELEGRARQYPARVGMFVKDLQHGWEWSYHADDLFPSASLIKVPVMAGVFAKINEGQLSLNSRLRLRRRVRMGGSGSLKWSRDGTRFTVRRLLEKLIHESDNTAMLLLIDEVGIGFLQQFFPRLGLVYTEIYPEGLLLTGGRVRYENYTTAREMGRLFERIYNGKVVDPFASELMLDILKRRPTKSRLAKDLPVGWEIAHKTGLLRQACHDAGIVFSPKGDYIITVLTGRNRSYHSAKEFITGVGRISYKYYRNEMGYYVKAPKAKKPKRGR